MGYYPGKLFFETDKSSQFDFTSDSLFLAFDYNVFLKNKHVIYNYKFLVSEFWLSQDFLVVKIYNLDKRKYRKLYDPLDKKRQYALELIYPGGQIIRIRHK